MSSEEKKQTEAMHSVAEMFNEVVEKYIPERLECEERLKVQLSIETMVMQGMVICGSMLHEVGEKAVLEFIDKKSQAVTMAKFAIKMSGPEDN